MTETTNFGLKKPEETDFYSVDTQNDNMDAIDSVLQEFKDGTQQVGDSIKLGGKDASEYVIKREVLNTSILEKALTLEEGVYNFELGRGNYTGTDLPNAQYAYGFATVYVPDANGATVVLWNQRYGLPLTINQHNGTSWLGWDTNVTTADLANYLPLSGGTVGYLYVQGASKNGYIHLLKNASATSDFGTMLSDYNVNKESVALKLSANNNAAVFVDVSGAEKNILHTGNKPSGSYTGNGSATSRTIDIGGIGEVLKVSGNARSFIVWQHGAIGMLYDEKNNGVIVIPQAEIKFTSGKLTIASSGVINASGATYTWQVL